MKRLLYIILLMIFPAGMIVAQNGGSPAKVPNNVKPLKKASGTNDSKPAALPSNVKPVDKTKTTSTKPTVAPLPKTAIKNKH